MPEASPGAKGASRCCTAADGHAAAHGRCTSAIGGTSHPATARPGSRPRAAPFPPSTARAPPSRPQRRAAALGRRRLWRTAEGAAAAREGRRLGPAAICSGSGQRPRPECSPGCIFGWKSLVAVGSKPNKPNNNNNFFFFFFGGGSGALLS